MGASLAPDFQSPTRARAETEAKRPPDFECCFLQSSSSPGADARGQLTELRQGFEMTDKFKKRVREHAKKHGMSYQAALQQLTQKIPPEPEGTIAVEMPAWVHVPRKILKDGVAIFSLPDCNEEELDTLHAEIKHQLGGEEPIGAIITNIDIDVEQLDRDRMGELGWGPLKDRGACLYKLPPPNDDTATEYADEAFHAWVEYARKLEKGHSPPGKKGPKTIIVNGREHKTEGDELSYEDVLELAYPGIDPTRILSVTVGHRDGRDAILIPGKSVRITSGAVFSAYDTSNA